MILHGINLHLNQHAGGGAIIPITSGGESLILDHQFTASTVTMNGQAPDTTDNTGGNTFVSPALTPSSRNGTMFQYAGVGKCSTIDGCAAVIDVGTANHRVEWDGKHNVTTPNCDHDGYVRRADGNNYFQASVVTSSALVRLYVITAGVASDLDTMSPSPTIYTAGDVVCHLAVDGSNNLTFTYDVTSVTADGITVLSATNASHSTATSAGVGNRVTGIPSEINNTHVSNLKIYSL